MQTILNLSDKENKYFGFYNKIQEQEFYIENFFKFTNDYIVILNNKKQIIMSSENFKHLFSSENIIDENFTKLMNRISDLPNDFLLEKQYFIKIKQDNKIKIFQAEICQNYPDSLSHMRYIIIFKDISLEKETELKENSFINTIKHDLKTPVRANIWALDLLLKKYGTIFNKEQNKIINEILNSNHLLFDMLDNLLAKFQYENDFKLTKSFINFNQLILEITKEFQPLFKEKNITPKLKFSNKDIMLFADKSKLKTALCNIISNSIKFNTKNGFVKIHVLIKENMASISITNTGIGISADKINYIFDKYINNATSYRKIGTGLNLYISKKIIAAHNGFINAESIPNSKTTFTVFLPLNN